MARSDKLYKRSYNACLDRLALGWEVSSISGLARDLGVSRNTARRIVVTLCANGLLVEQGGGFKALRNAIGTDYFSDDVVLSTEDFLESAFMELILREDIRPGARIREAVIARQLDVSTSSVREFLIKLSRFGFIRKEPGKSWVFDGFNRAYADELHEVRLLFEMRAIDKLIVLPEEDRFWPSISRMLTEHREFLKHYEERYLEFPKLDTRFHRLLNQASRNRFMDSFQDVIALIFHYHYRWNKVDEKERNCTAAREHIRIIEAIILRNMQEAKNALEAHLKTAEVTLKKSVEW
ncbi:FCD domain-containing protein [Thalassospira alkalitolerans]|uniref:GntR family transcriptional regulator n=1 Tax=Thalassospira alkalitolerans TaxID=1293890 RepID=UPI003AA878F8